uniref:Uncharacterized protein n=1 Tax=Triticum urartu TaxID=4572 RepID=A0A8R7UKJ9_TRIUA
MSSSPPSPSLPVTTGAAAAPLATGSLVLPSASLDLIPGASPGHPPAPITTTPPSPSTLPAHYTPEAMAGVLNDLVVTVQGIQLFLASPYGPPQPPPLPAPSGPPTLPWYSVPAALAGGYPALQQPPPPRRLRRPPRPPPPTAGLSQGPSGGLPIQQVRFPPSPSPIPAWLTGTSPLPVYTEAGEPAVPTLQFGAPSSALRIDEPVGTGASTPTPARFARIDFVTYDGSEDPLNWLNQCDQ